MKHQDPQNSFSAQESIRIQPGRLAAEGDENNAVRDAQERIRRMLEEGRPIPVGPSGDVTGTNGEEPVIQVQPGKLAAIRPWYEKEPERLKMEKELMKRVFPQFQLMKLSDGRLAWSGTLRPNLLGRNSFDWNLLATYNNDHPQEVMGSSVRVSLVYPTIEDVSEALHWTPSHLLYDSNDGHYLCTTRAEDVPCAGKGGYETTAVQSLTWANKWLCALELVLAGKLSRKKFNQHDGI